MDERVQDEVAKNRADYMARLKKKHDRPEWKVFFGLIRLRGPPPHHQIETKRLNGAPAPGDITFLDGGWIYYEDKCAVCGQTWPVRRERGYYDNGLFG
jgi:hypothetical protein